MKKPVLFFVIIIVLTLSFGAWKVYNDVYFKKDKQAATLKCHYMAYACGDCYPQWRVDSGSAIARGFNELVGKDIYAERKGVSLEELITDSAA